MIEFSFTWALLPRHWKIGRGVAEVEEDPVEGTLGCKAWSLWLGPFSLMLTVYFISQS